MTLHMYVYIDMYMNSQPLRQGKAKQLRMYMYMYMYMYMCICVWHVHVCIPVCTFWVHHGKHIVHKQGDGLWEADKRGAPEDEVAHIVTLTERE